MQAMLEMLVDWYFGNVGNAGDAGGCWCRNAGNAGDAGKLAGFVMPRQTPALHTCQWHHYRHHQHHTCLNIGSRQTLLKTSWSPIDLLQPVRLTNR